jgi:predicted metal-dependent hydrolase
MVQVKTVKGLKFSIYKDFNLSEKQKILSSVIENMLALKEHLIKNKDNFEEYKEYIEQLDENFSSDKTTIYETEPESNLTSYSVNKGQELSICLKSKKTNKIHDVNLLMYVVIHEMAHMGCPEIGHGDLFKEIFKFFIEQAIKIGIYTYVDYNNNPVEYCGMNLSSSIV